MVILRTINFIRNALPIWVFYSR